MANLTEEELKIITDLQKEFVEKKVQLGDAVIVQHNLMSDVNILRAKFSQEEQKLIKKYGEDSVINLKTGEVTKNKKYTPKGEPQYEIWASFFSGSRDRLSNSRTRVRNPVSKKGQKQVPKSGNLRMVSGWPGRVWSRRI